MKVSLFIPCLVDQAKPDTGIAVMNVLERLGCEISYDSRQTCCGQAQFNAGFREHAKPLAEKLIRIFHNREVIVGASASCVSMIKEHYNELDLTGWYFREWQSLKNRIFEFTEFVVDRMSITDVGAYFPHKVGIHHSCHALRELGIKQQPLELLKSVEGLELSGDEWEDECCGFGGAFSMKFPELSNRMADRRAQTLTDGNAQYITGVDDSCLHHLQQAFLRKNTNSQLIPQTLHIARILQNVRDIRQ